MENTKVVETLHNKHQKYWETAQQRKYPNRRQYLQDQKFGVAVEKSTLSIIKQIMGEHMRQDKDKYACLDYYSSLFKVKAECKARRNSKDKYPTTMVGENKMVEAERLSLIGYEVLFFFNFTDGLYYFKYSNLKKIRSHKKMGGTYSRGLREMKLYRYINVNDLQKVDITEPIHYMKTKRVNNTANKNVKV